MQQQDKQSATLISSCFARNCSHSWKSPRVQPVHHHPPGLPARPNNNGLSGHPCRPGHPSAVPILHPTLPLSAPSCLHTSIFYSILSYSILSYPVIHKLGTYSASICHPICLPINHSQRPIRFIISITPCNIFIYPISLELDSLLVTNYSNITYNIIYSYSINTTIPSLVYRLSLMYLSPYPNTQISLTPYSLFSIHNKHHFISLYSTYALLSSLIIIFNLK